MAKSCKVLQRSCKNLQDLDKIDNKIMASIDHGKILQDLTKILQDLDKIDNKIMARS